MLGNTNTARAGTMNWKFGDEDLFNSFCEYAYYDTYTSPKIHDPISGEPYDMDELFYPVGRLGSQHDFLYKTLWDRYRSPSGKHVVMRAKWKWISSFEWEEDRINYLMRHANMYVIGLAYGIESLKVLALYKLADALMHFVSRRTSTVSLVKLADFTYAKTKSEDELRELVSIYAASRYESLVNCPSVEDAFLRNPAFCLDTLKQVAKRRQFEDRLSQHKSAINAKKLRKEASTKTLVGTSTQVSAKKEESSTSRKSSKSKKASKSKKYYSSSDYSSSGE